MVGIHAHAGDAVLFVKNLLEKRRRFFAAVGVVAVVLMIASLFFSVAGLPLSVAGVRTDLPIVITIGFGALIGTSVGVFLLGLGVLGFTPRLDRVVDFVQRRSMLKGITRIGKNV